MGVDCTTFTSITFQTGFRTALAGRACLPVTAIRNVQAQGCSVINDAVVSTATTTRKLVTATVDSTFQVSASGIPLATLLNQVNVIARSPLTINGVSIPVSALSLSKTSAPSLAPTNQPNPPTPAATTVAPNLTLLALLVLLVIPILIGVFVGIYAPNCKPIDPRNRNNRFGSPWSRPRIQQRRNNIYHSYPMIRNTSDNPAVTRNMPPYNSSFYKYPVIMMIPPPVIPPSQQSMRQVGRISQRYSNPMGGQQARISQRYSSNGDLYPEYQRNPSFVEYINTAGTTDPAAVDIIPNPSNAV